MTDQRAAECHERQVAVGASLVAGGQTSELHQPSEGALDDPAAPTQAIGALDATARNAREDAANAQRLSADPKVVAPIGVQLALPATRSSGLAVAYPRHEIAHPAEQQMVVQVGRREIYSERDATPFDENVSSEPALPLSVGFGPLKGPFFGRQAA
jgi:hypothetical protein